MKRRGMSRIFYDAGLVLIVILGIALLAIALAFGVAIGMRII